MAEWLVNAAEQGVSRHNRNDEGKPRFPNPDAYEIGGDKRDSQKWLL